MSMGRAVAAPSGRLDAVQGLVKAATKVSVAREWQRDYSCPN